MPLREPLAVEIWSLLAGSMAWSHGDPFDRMLAAQAISEDLTLATRDPVFAELVGVRVRW